MTIANTNIIKFITTVGIIPIFDVYNVIIIVNNVIIVPNNACIVKDNIASLSVFHEIYNK